MALDPNARLIITASDATRAAWDSAVRTANAGSARISGALKGAFGGLSVAAIGLGLAKTVGAALEFGDAIGKAAVKSGLGSQAISELAFAAKGSNISIEDLSKSIGTMQINISKAVQGSKPLIDSFEELGVDFQKFRALRPDRQFEVLAEAINQVTEPTDKARLATEIFGKAGASLLPLFSEGAEGIRKAREESVRLGLALGDEQQAKLQAAGDAIGKLKEAAAGLGRELALAVGPSITKFTNNLTEMIAEANGAPASIAAITAEIKRLDEEIQISEGKGTFGLALAGRLDLDGRAEEIAKRRSELAKQLEEKAKGEASTEGVLKDRIEIELPGQGPLPGLLQGPDPDIRRRIDELKQLRELEMEGEQERNRILDEALGSGVQGERRERMLQEEREHFEKLQGIVEDNAEQSIEASEKVLDEYADRLTEKVTERNDVLRGALEEFGRSVQSSLSDVFFNAGKGADKFADSVLDAFKRIISDAAASKVVELLGGLLGGKKDTGVGGGSSTGGFGALVAGALGGLTGFGGARAEGGPVTGGLGYLIGERGPELFLPRQSGTVLPNSALRGGIGVVVNMPVNIDARGATQDGMKLLMQQLPAILERNNRSLKAGLNEDLRRGRPQFT